MIIQYDQENDREPEIIDDVVSAGAEPFIDVSWDSVQDQPIGRLEQQYIQSQQLVKSIQHRRQPTHSKRFVRTVRQRPRIKPVAVPLFESVASLYEESLDHHAAVLPIGLANPAAQLATAFRSLAQRASTEARRAKRPVAEAALGLASGLGALRMPWLPKYYTARQGLTTDWHTTTFERAKATAPFLVTFLVAALFAPATYTYFHNHMFASKKPAAQSANHNHTAPGNQTITLSHSKQQTGTAQSSSSKPATVSNTTAGQTANSSPAPTGGSPTPSTSTPGTSTITGGLGGGGPVSTATGSLPSTGSITAPITSTTPTSSTAPTPTTPTTSPSPAPNPIVSTPSLSVTAPQTTVTPTPTTTVTVPSTNVQVNNTPVASTGSVSLGL